MARTDVVLLAGHEITENVGAFVVGEAEVAMKHLPSERRHGVFRKEPSPREIASVGGLHGRPELSAHRGISAVGADQEIACLSIAVLELRDPPMISARRRFELFTLVIGMYSFRTRLGGWTWCKPVRCVEDEACVQALGPAGRVRMMRGAALLAPIAPGASSRGQL
jgi:hypothetical protein